MVSLDARIKSEAAPKNRKKTHHPLGGLPLKFAAFDGEGFTDPDGVHRYKLLAIGQDQITNPHGLEFTEIMEFLYDHFEKGTAFVGFFLGYDFTQWFKTLPEERARMLLTQEGIKARQRRLTNSIEGKNKHAIAPHPVQYHGWQFDLLGSKRLRIRPKYCDCPFQSCKCNHAPWMYLCDVGGFFQTSFLNVIDPKRWPEPILTAEEFAKILEGKRQRSTAVLDSATMAYNRLENVVLQRVMGEVDKGLRAVDVKLTPSKWFGPGQAAQAWMRGKAPTREDIERLTPDHILRAAMASYYGGWFEIMMHGMIPGVTHEYDINSAYPYIIAHLPCLLHGKWQQGVGRPNVGAREYCLVRAWVWTQAYAERRKKHHIGAMLHRDANGRISRPLMTKGWYWWHELQAARRAKCVTRITDDRYYEWVKYTPCECMPPLRRVANLYLQRLAVGKDTPMGKGAKTVYNSKYGKFAQSVGDPLFGNPIYASLITAGCRTMILNAIASHPKGKSNVAMVATDAVYFRSPHPSLRCSENLGEWSHTERSNIALFKPGVYWDDRTRKQIAAGDAPVFKARGVNAAAFAPELARIDREFSDSTGILVSNSWPTVSFRPSFAMTTALQALEQGDWSKAGHVSTDSEVKQSADPWGKRCEAYLDDDGIIRTEPHWFGDGSGWRYAMREKPPRTWIECESVGYTKRFGMEDPFNDLNKELYGVDPDGYITNQFRDALGMESK